MFKEILDTQPIDYKPLRFATTAPKGAQWWWNGKSIFGKEFHAVLVKLNEENQCENT